MANPDKAASAGFLKASEARLIVSRMRRIAGSASNAASQRARELAAAGQDVINMTVGEPPFETPENIKQAATAAMNSGQTRYTSVDGTPMLKQAIINKFTRENGLEFDKSEVIAATGAKQIIFNALLCTVDKGDEVVIPAPCWVSYPEMTRLAGGSPVMLPCSEDSDFELTADRLRHAIGPKTKWLILNSPNNPTGATYTEPELRALGEVLRDNPQVWVLSDDIYEHIIYDRQKFATMAAVNRDLASRILTVNGVSKAYSMTGWRIGYAAGPQFLIKEMAKLQSQSTSNPSSISQAAAVAALNGPQELVVERSNQLREHRDLIVRELSNVPGILCTLPAGAFYIFPSCAGAIGTVTPGGHRIETDGDFVHYLLESGVAAIAGSWYGLSPHFRLSFAVSIPLILEGCRRIREACLNLQ